MVYKPNFCCNCGEKIARAEWKLFTSRRFCDVCSVEQKGHELMVRAVAAGCLLTGILGIGSYLRSPEQPRMVLAVDQSTGVTTSAMPALKPHSAAKETDQIGTSMADGAEPGALPAQPLPGRAAASKEQLRSQGFASDNPVFYCGAMTKKGKPCSRRVKSKGRCWQHAGQPSSPALPSAADVY